MNGWLIAAVSIYGLALIFVLALCKASAAADRQSENWMEQKEYPDSE